VKWWASVVGATLVVLLAASPASAWGNGATGANGFGTHDWVLRQAVRAAGRSGDWICLHAAMRATDDPDTRDGIDHASGTWWHVYDVWGRSRYGDAPQAVRVWFRRTQRLRFTEHDRCGASRAVGIMSHMLADVAQPMHTDGYLRAEDRVHASYEHAVDRRCSRSRCRYRMRFNGRDFARPFMRTIVLANHAHRYYRGLVRTYARHGYNAKVDRITERQLNRAANALADIIVSLNKVRFD
jgi:hypothetical protein